MGLLEKARAIAAQFEFPDGAVRACCAHFVGELGEQPLNTNFEKINKLTHSIGDGLRERTATVCQIPTYVTQVAHGIEQGLSMAIDLGGTNLRVCSVEFWGDAKYDMKQSKIAIPPSIMTASKGSELFAFIAEQIAKFLEMYHADMLRVPIQSPVSLGFTFSYPAYQNDINSGILLRWTKGFNIPDVVGQDVCKLLQMAIDDIKLPVKITALVNDALGALMFRAYTLPISKIRTSVGAIFGTGTNGVYFENLSNITKRLDGAYSPASGKMFISCEWGSFDNTLKVQPNTKYDASVDAASVNPGNQMFEKRVSGMFLGELLRITLVELHAETEGKVFGAWQSEGDAERDQVGKAIPFVTRWAVDTSILSAAEADNTCDLLSLRDKIEETLGIPRAVVSIEDAQAVKIIAGAIGRRAARLAGTALAATILKGELLSSSLDAEDDPTSNTHSRHANECTLVDIAVDGSVVEFYPGFEGYIREAWRSVEGIGPTFEPRIKMGIAKDGSSIGAAIIALIAAASLDASTSS